MTDRRVQEAVDAAIKEGRILSNRGVNADALLGETTKPNVPAFVPTPAREAFAIRIFEARAKECKNEAEWQRAVIELARTYGWRIAHFRAARVTRGGVEKYETPIAEDGIGFLDLELVRERLVKVELKFGSNTPTAEQLEWIKAYNNAEIECYVWYPYEWHDVIKTLKPRESQ